MSTASTGTDYFEILFPGPFFILEERNLFSYLFHIV